MKQYVSKFSGKELDERLTRVDDIPTKTSELNNDSGFISEIEADNKYTDKNKTDVLEGDIKTLKDKVDNLENSPLGKGIFEIEVVDGASSSLHLPKRNTVVYNLYEDTKEYLYINTPTVIEEESTDSNFYWKITWDGEGNLKIKEVFQEVLLPDHFEIYQYAEDIDEILIPTSIPRKKDFKTINGQPILGSGNIDVKVPTKVSQLENDQNYIDEETFTTTLENDYVLKDDDYAVADGLRDSDDLIFYLPSTAPADTDNMLLTNGSLKTINGESIVGNGDITIKGGVVSSYITNFTYRELREVAFSEGKSIECNVQLIEDALRNNIPVFVPIDTTDPSFYGYAVLEGYAEDFLYFSVKTANEIIGVDISRTASEIRSEDINKKGVIAIEEESVSKEIVGDLEVANVKGLYSGGSVYALPDAATGDEDDILLSRDTVKTINGESIVGSGDITIEGGGSNIYTWLWNGNDAGFISQSEYDAIQNADAVMISFEGDAIYHAERIGPTLQFHIILLDEIFTYTFEFSENGNSIQWICTITSIKNDNTEIKETLDEIVDEEGYLYSNGEKVNMRFTSAITDKTLTTPNAVGGIAKGTKVSDLEGKTFAEMFDDLLFPTVNPTFTSPSASIAFKSYSSTQEVGATGPTSANFTTGYSAGEIKLNGVKQANRGGTNNIPRSFIYVNGSASNKTLPSKVTLGKTTFNYRAAYNQGPQPKNNKGGNYDSPLSAGTVDSSAITLNGTYPWYASTSAATSTNPVVKQSLVAWNSTAGKMSTGQFTVQPSGTLPQVFKLPRKLHTLQLKNALNGQMETVTNVSKDYTESTETINIGGTNVTYYVYTYSGSTRGSVTLLAKF